MSSSDTPTGRARIDGWNPTIGEVCEHGSLRRKCDVCYLSFEVERLEDELAAMTADRDAQKAGWDACSLVCLRLERERNEARECLREAVAFVEVGNPSLVSLSRWRKAAGLA